MDQQVRNAPYMSAQENKPAIALRIYTLSNTQYLELEKQALARIQFRDETNDIQAGYLLGVEAVLRLIRKGFVAG